MSSSVRHRLTHARAVTLTIIGLSCSAWVLSGCGGGRIVDPSLVRTAQPTGFIVASYPADGIELSVPDNWTITAEPAPMIAVISSGQAVVSLWRYPTHGRLAPTGTVQLHAALGALETAARHRDPGLKIEASAISRVGSAGAVILDAIERVAGKLRRVRSEHVYLADAEIVLETYAPVSQFSADDDSVFSPVRRSLTLLHGGQPTQGQATTSTTVTPVPATPPGSTGTPTASGTASGTPTGTPTATASATSIATPAGTLP